MFRGWTGECKVRARPDGRHLGPSATSIGSWRDATAAAYLPCGETEVTRALSTKGIAGALRDLSHYQHHTTTATTNDSAGSSSSTSSSTSSNSMDNNITPTARLDGLQHTRELEQLGQRDRARVDDVEEGRRARQPERAHALACEPVARLRPRMCGEAAGLSEAGLLKRAHETITRAA